MTVLAMPLSLGDGPGRIEDVEALVRKVIEDRLRQWGARLKELDHEDLVSYLIGVCWELSGRYDPAKDKNPNFAAYAARILTLRVADWYRQRFGDTRHGEKPVVLSLDAPLVLESSGSDASESADRLVDTLAASTGDPAVDRSPDLVGLLERGSGSGLGSHNAVGKSQARRASSGNRSSTGGLKRKPPRVPGTSRGPARPPICGSCFTTFKTVFTKVNGKLPKERRESDEQITLRAAKRAQAVRFGTEWACPRCTKLSTGPTKEGFTPQELMLQTAYPNRAIRRQAAANKPLGTKNAGANKGRGKAKRQAAAAAKATTKKATSTRARKAA